MIKVYCDLDSVLADFIKLFEKLFIPIHTAESSRKVAELLHTYPDFFIELEMLPDAGELWSYLTSIPEFDVEILTAIPKHDLCPNSIEHKKLWVAKHLGPEVVVNISPYAKDKKNYCTSSTDILIDDMHKNITDWISVGGIGILHTSAQDTIQQLKDVCGKML